MANVLEGYVTGKGLKFGIVVARFNEFITSKLLGGALDTLHRHEAGDAGSPRRHDGRQQARRRRDGSHGDGEPPEENRLRARRGL